MVLTARFREYSRIFSRLEWVVVEDVVLFFKVPYTHSCYSLADMLWNAWMSLLLMNVLLINVCTLHIRSLSISGPCGHWHGGKGVFSIALGMPRNQSTTEIHNTRVQFAYKNHWSHKGSNEPSPLHDNYVGTGRTRGMSAHITISIDIIDTTLEPGGQISSRPSQSPSRHSQRLETGDAKL